MIAGQGVSKGYSIGKLFKYENNIEIPFYVIRDVETEMSRLNKSVDLCTVDLNDLFETTLLSLGEDKAQLFKAHIFMLKDPEFLNSINQKIKNNVNAEHAVKETSKTFEEIFLNMDNAYFVERAGDIKDVSERLIYKLLGKNKMNLKNIPKGSILFSYDLKPSDTAQLNKENIVGIITEIGGETSHSAIIARGLGIPAVMGIGSDTVLRHDDVVIVDGDDGWIHLSPEQKTINEYQEKMILRTKKNKQLESYMEQSFNYPDGRKIEIAGNIASPEDAELVVLSGGEGVGLFRSEFLYMNKSYSPTEEEQFEAYKKSMVLMSGQPVTIRTMDIGGDKEVEYMKMDRELNPFLGYRAIRYCFDHLDIFKTQLRALYRASAFGRLRIMFPMVSNLSEVLQIKEIVKEVKLELKNENFKYDDAVEIGIMIEVPSAAMMSDVLAKHVDFASIGTNDLTQYTLASDRMNPKVKNIYSNFDPAVIRLIHMTVVNFHKESKWVGMCGSAAGNILLIPLWYGMCLDEFSMSASSILEAKEVISQLTRDNTEQLLVDVLALGSKEDVKAYLTQYATKN